MKSIEMPAQIYVRPRPAGTTVRAYAPATVANVVCGYDILGFAVSQPCDEVEMTLNSSGKVTLDLVAGDNGSLPLHPLKNVASAVVINYLEKIGHAPGVSMRLFKHMPLNSGMGSSSASSVAALVAINDLMGKPLSRMELLPLAMEGELLACGNAHADNVAPALLGGLVLVRSYKPLDIIQLPYPKEIFVAIVHPHVDVPTGEARKIIKERIALRDAVVQWGNIAGLVSGFFLNDIGLIGRSMQDVLIEPARAVLIPCFYEMKELAIQSGAAGFGISGSGPSVFALCQDKKSADEVATKLSALLMQRSIGSETFVSGINRQGAGIIQK